MSTGWKWILAVVAVLFLPLSILFAVRSPGKILNKQVSSRTEIKSVGTAETEIPELILRYDNEDRAAHNVWRANLYLKKGYYGEALKKAEEALRLGPSNAATLAAAIQARNEALNPRGSDQVLLEEADAYFEKSRFAAAVQLYNAYAERHPDKGSACLPRILACYYNLGVLALKEGRCNEAGDYFRQNLFIVTDHALSKQMLDLTEQCKKADPSDLEFRMKVAFTSLLP